MLGRLDPRQWRVASFPAAGTGMQTRDETPIVVVIVVVSGGVAPSATFGGGPVLTEEEAAVSLIVADDGDHRLVVMSTLERLDPRLWRGVLLFEGDTWEGEEGKQLVGSAVSGTTPF